MTTLLLVRHAACDAVGKSLAGRAAGVHLNAEGRSQARRLSERLADVPFVAVYSSPLERARETAAAIAAAAGLPVRGEEGLTELDFGEWTGRNFDELHCGDQADVWRGFNAFRSGTRVPGGETMVEAQARAVAALLAIAARHRDGVVVAVSHSDVIKAVLGYFAGVPLDLLQRLEVGPASVSVVALDANGARIIRLNETGGPVHA